MTPYKLAAIAYILNLFDAASTLVILGPLHGREFNPAMGWLIHTSPALFLIVKVLAMAGLLVTLAEWKAVRTLAAVIMCYGILALGHIVILATGVW